MPKRHSAYSRAELSTSPVSLALPYCTQPPRQSIVLTAPHGRLHKGALREPAKGRSTALGRRRWYVWPVTLAHTSTRFHTRLHTSPPRPPRPCAQCDPPTWIRAHDLLTQAHTRRLRRLCRRAGAFARPLLLCDDDRPCGIDPDLDRRSGPLHGMVPRLGAYHDQ